MRRILPVILFLLTGCVGTDCSELPSSFASFKEAEDLIEQSRFALADDLNTSRSSWIRGARYYSCDRQTGFFVLVTDNEEYLYQNLPIQIWTEFKAAGSLGAYYNARIKHRYPLMMVGR